MTASQCTGELKTDDETTYLEWAWFCLRSQHKHEPVAAGFLRQMEGVEVFYPRLRFVQPRRYRKVWITEPLFPCYLFARFNWKEALTRVHYAPGVQSVVHFGNRWPTVPEAVITELREAMGTEEMRIIPDQPEPGDEVQIIGEAFQGLRAIVTQVMPGRERVAVLMDFLGRQMTVDVSAHHVITQGAQR